MAVLTKEDRIATSLRLVGIEDELKAADAGLVDAVKSLADLTKKDEPNRKLLLEKTNNIKPYQDELLLLDGIQRTELTEVIMENSVNRLLNNSLYPNDLNTPLPSVPDGVWKFFIPFLGNHGIGKTSFEVFQSTGARTEQNILNDIQVQFSLIEAEADPNRATGLKCDAGGSCAGESTPPQTTQSACTLDGGVWTPGADGYSADATIVSLLSSLKTLVQEWEDRINAEKALIPVAIEKNSTRITGNNSAIADIDNAIAIIDTWQATQDYDTATILPTGNDGTACVIYNALVEADFEQAKLTQTTINILKAEVTARSAYAATRLSELAGPNYLGSVTQDLSSGSITAFTGLYGERSLLIDLRTNALAGSLTKKIGVSRNKGIQEQFKESSNNADSALSLAMKAVKATAPGIDTKYINVKSSSGFLVGDRVFVVANDQEELSASIEEISNNRIKLTCVVPKKYTTSNKTRLYKVL